MPIKSFKQFFEDCGHCVEDQERESTSSFESAAFPEITITEQELEDTIDDPDKRLPNGKSLLKRFTMAIVNVDGTYTLSQVPDWLMLKAEISERGSSTPLNYGGKEWDVVEVMKLYRKAPFPTDGSGKRFAGALIKVAEA